MTFLYLNSDRIGQGDAELGRTLLLLFLQTLVASEVAVDFVACLNGAALLITCSAGTLSGSEPWAACSRPSSSSRPPTASSRPADGRQPAPSTSPFASSAQEFSTPVQTSF